MLALPAEKIYSLLGESTEGLQYQLLLVLKDFLGILSKCTDKSWKGKSQPVPKLRAGGNSLGCGEPAGTEQDPSLQVHAAGTGAGGTWS